MALATLATAFPTAKLLLTNKLLRIIILKKHSSKALLCFNKYIFTTKFNLLAAIMQTVKNLLFLDVLILEHHRLNQ